jgi:hypothetical protein
MIIKTGFPEYIESIAIGDDPSFLKENTDLCQTAIDFEAEINLAYLWKKIYTDPDTLDAVRDFTKNFLLDAPNLTTEHVLFYRNKIDQLPADIKEKLKEEVDNTFKKADNLSLRIKTTPSIERRFTRSVSIDNDKDFLQKIADLMNQCNSACNYFKNLSHRVGSIYDYSAVNTIHNSPPQDVDLNSPPPTGLTLEKVNKLPTKLWDCTSEAYTSLKVFSDKAKAAMHNFVSNYSLEKLGKKAQSSDEKGALYIGATSPSIFQETMEAYSKGVANNRMMFGDCFRLIDYMSRYNPFNPDMNIAKLIDKDIGIKTLEVVNGEYRERIIKVKPNGVNSRLSKEKSYGLSPSPLTYRGLNDEKKRLDDVCIKQIESRLASGSTIRDSNGNIRVDKELLLLLCSFFETPQFANLRITSAYRTNSVTHGQGKAVDFGFNTNKRLGSDQSFQKEVVTWWVSNGAGGAGWEGDHLHIDFRSNYTFFGPDKTRNSLSSTPEWFRNIANDPTSYIKRRTENS